MSNKITVSTIVGAPLEVAWEKFTSPNEIVKWCFASDDWHCPSAKNDLQVGGKFNTRMEAKDGSFGFDFEGEYTQVELNKFYKYKLVDAREVEIHFEAISNNFTRVTEVFDAENENPLEMQRMGWQFILNNFKKHADGKGIDKLYFEIAINASCEKVYTSVIDDEKYRIWTKPFNENCYYKGSWNKGEKIYFVGTDAEGNESGMVSRIKENVPNVYVCIEHLGEYKNGNEITTGENIEKWAGCLEEYIFEKNADGTTFFKAYLDNVEKSFEDYFKETWPKAIAILKEICEK